MTTTPDDQADLPPALQADHPLRGLGYGEPVQPRSAVPLGGPDREAAEVPIAEEVPVALVYNGRPHAVMMATPADLGDFALGFTLTEGIAARGEVTVGDVVRHAQGIEVSLTIPETRAAALDRRGRVLTGRTGCGLCGVESIQEAMRLPPTVSTGFRLSLDALWRAEAELPARQPWNRDTGALHAAAWASADGALLCVREDVGRHNALDKLIGACAVDGVDLTIGFAVVTSRASYELVQKAATAGIPVLAAVSRPTGLAIRMAEAAGVTLVGLLRGRTASVYAHPERLSARDVG